MTAPAAPDRIVIQYPKPSVDGGRYPLKRCAGDTVPVTVDIFRDGHEQLRAVVRARPVGGERWLERALHPTDAHLDGVRWAGEFTVEEIGNWEYVIEAWSDRFGTWREELRRKLEADQQDLTGELSEGELLLRTAAARAEGSADADTIERAAALIAERTLAPVGAAAPLAAAPTSYDLILSDELAEAVARCDPRERRTTFGPLPVRVDRQRARFGSWYELFPRSWGGLKGVERQVPRLAELGFDVIYLPPIHPIGRTNRKGPNNALTAGPADPGSPWAIGDARGGHDAVHPDLGTEQDLKRLIRTARKHGIDVALDFAIQCSADHPWLTEHPEWFHRRPDGTLKYAENPPKRYQDIYNVNWDTDDWVALWEALRAIVLKWVDLGIKVFRVDNPHTKPIPFWAWLIEEVQRHDPEVVFLAEAFTRRAMMRHLAKVGFSQSYTYFTWKNTRWELTEYLDELAGTEEAEYFRPNFFANTPDILHAYLVDGGPPAFRARAVLAATLSPSYGIYSGFEHYENVPIRSGSEEYLDSEKYEIRQRALDGPLLPLLQRLNETRRANPALQRFDNLTFLETENEALIAYAKSTAGNTVITVVNLDPHHDQIGVAVVPARLGLPPVFAVRDRLADGDAEYGWRLGPNYIGLPPGGAHVMVVAP